MLVGVRDAAVVLFLELVFLGVGRGIAPQPELLDELLALLVGLQPLEGRSLFVGDDVTDVFVEPLLIGRFQLFAELRFVLLSLLVGEGLGNGLAALGICAGRSCPYLCPTSPWPRPIVKSTLTDRQAIQRRAGLMAHRLLRADWSLTISILLPQKTVRQVGQFLTVRRFPDGPASKPHSPSIVTFTGSRTPIERACRSQHQCTKSPSSG